MNSINSLQNSMIDYSNQMNNNRNKIAQSTTDNYNTTTEDRLNNDDNNINNNNREKQEEIMNSRTSFQNNISELITEQIVIENGYNAQAKAIRSNDDMMSNLINLKI